MGVAVTIVASTFLVLGFFFIFTGAVGILRFPDFYTRLHAMGKSDTIGIALMMLGLAVLEGVTLNSIKILFIILFVSFASPTATHALAKAALHGGMMPSATRWALFFVYL